MRKNEMPLIIPILAVGLIAFIVLPKLLKKPKEVSWKDELEADDAVNWVKDFLATTEPFENL